MVLLIRPLPSCALLVLVVMSGCAEEPNGVPTDGHTSSPSSASGPELDPEFLSPPASNGFFGNDCYGIGVFTYWPARTGPAGSEVPPSWEDTPATSPGATSHYSLQLNRCERVSIGPFERGPVTFLVEGHDQADFPADCITSDGHLNGVSVLAAVWVDDEAIADWLSDRYGVPTHVASFQPINETTAGVRDIGWRWSVEGQAESVLHFPLVSEEHPRIQPTYRWLFHNGTSVTAMDWSDDYHPFTDFSLGVHMYGTLESPTVYARMGVTPFVGRGDAAEDGAFSVDFKRFGDLECKEPL